MALLLLGRTSGLIGLPPDSQKYLYVLFYKTELRLHQRNRAEAHLCIKNQGLISIAEQIFDDYKPGVMSRAQPKWFKDRGAWIETRPVAGFVIYFIKMLLSIGFLYLDMIRDLSLIAALLGIVTISSIFSYPNIFASQIIWLLILSVAIPLLATGITIAKKYPFIIFGYRVHSHFEQNPVGRCKLVLVQILIVLLAVFFPAFLIIVKEGEKEKTRQLYKEGVDDKEKLREAQKRIQFVDMVSDAILDYKKAEFSFEIVIQLTIQTLMLLMNFTNTGTSSGRHSSFFNY